MEQQNQKSGLAIASLVLGLLSFIPSLFGYFIRLGVFSSSIVLKVFFGIVAVILGVMVLKRNKDLGLNSGAKIAKFGIVFGALGIIYILALLTFFFFVLFPLL